MSIIVVLNLNFSSFFESAATITRIGDSDSEVANVIDTKVVLQYARYLVETFRYSTSPH